ncbi:cis-prenyltransferase 4, chloroplastic-like [Zingiber officinale]|uniref:Alkyl transferase n=1 Tax=Zingiber officinale TaxID=94328 RepID=A0A8J5F5I8_ZINOF|nr:cis-prenyltransferase 4, chloroplastic-like [Zingiber officinale]KAG6481313.1 hypothetical protein ZIOFF_057909 [Zingiber officinale]
MLSYSSLQLTSPFNHHQTLLSSAPRRGITWNDSSASVLPCRPRASPSLISSLPPVARSLPENSPAATLVDEAEQGAALSLPSPLRRELLPSHVAIIMDGNSRWARARGLPSTLGHEAGYRALKKVVEHSHKWGIRGLTVFAFSTENWRRPKVEVDFLMMLFERVLKEDILELTKDGVRICLIGDSTELPKSLQNLSKEIIEATKNNTKLDLSVAISYSGRRDITQACKSIAEKVKHGLVEPEDITESLVAQELETNRILEFPYPDLLIRTSGELRLSNFLLWQSAYSELFFTDTYWPDFKEANYVEALASYQTRQRRFGQRI